MLLQLHCIHVVASELFCPDSFFYGILDGLPGFAGTEKKIESRKEKKFRLGN